MHPLKDLFDNNKRWAQRMTRVDPDFFRHLTEQQTPEYLWIGCSDSRVPANEIVGLPPGELFVHRNVANIVIHTDINCLSVLQYAVDILRVKHIIVCGHYGCGGVKAALEDQAHGLIDNWIHNVREIYEVHRERVDAEPEVARRLALMCELNVVEQAKKVYRTTIVQQALQRGQTLTIHGLIYDITDGILKDLEVRFPGIP
ncbi:MAG: carbonate dehydratase [Gammaproteobacteria bacterium]|nr:carbonate dehydratase [Gammaproteobacteria bacterium]